MPSMTQRQVEKLALAAWDIAVMRNAEYMHPETPAFGPEASANAEANFVWFDAATWLPGGVVTTPHLVGHGL